VQFRHVLQEPERKKFFLAPAPASAASVEVTTKVYSTIAHRLKCLPGYKTRQDFTDRSQVLSDYSFYANSAAPFHHMLETHLGIDAPVILTAHRIEFRVAVIPPARKNGTTDDWAFAAFCTRLQHTFTNLVKRTESLQPPIDYSTLPLASQRRLADAMLDAAARSDLAIEDLRQGGIISKQPDAEQVRQRIGVVASALGNCDRATVKAIRTMDNWSQLSATWSATTIEMKGADLVQQRAKYPSQATLTFSECAKQRIPPDYTVEQFWELCIRVHTQPLRYVFVHNKHQTLNVFTFLKHPKNNSRALAQRQPHQLLLNVARSYADYEYNTRIAGERPKRLDQFMNTSHKKHEVRLKMEFVDDSEPDHPHTLTAEELARITGDEYNDPKGSDIHENEEDEQEEEEDEEDSFSVLSEGEDEEAEAEDDEDDSQYSE